MEPPISPGLQNLHRLDTSSSDLNDRLCNVLYGEEYVRCASILDRGDDLTWLVNYLDEANLIFVPSSSAQTVL
jgi:hypothetical protein